MELDLPHDHYFSYSSTFDGDVLDEMAITVYNDYGILITQEKENLDNQI